MKQIEYPLLALNMTEEDCKEIEKPLMKTGLPAIGLSTNTSRKMVFGPETYQGVGIKSIFHEMMHRHIRAIITEGDRETITGYLLRSTIEQHHLETGWGGPLFEQPLDILEPCTTNTWIRETWRYLCNNDLRLQDATGQPTLRRHNDQYLMRCFVSSGY